MQWYTMSQTLYANTEIWNNFYVKIGNALYFFLDALQVLRNTTMMQKETTSLSNRWDAPADIMMTEYRLEVLQEYSREKRAYTKRHEGGIEALQAKRREAVQRPAIPICGTVL